MTTPIDRAAESLRGTVLTGRRALNPSQATHAALAVFASIDVDDLADALDKAHHPEDDHLDWGDFYDFAQTVKAHLTGEHP